MVNIQIHLLLRGMVPVSSKRSANRNAKEYFGENYGVEWDFRNYPINWHPYNNYSNLYYYEKYNINNRINNTCFSLVM